MWQQLAVGSLTLAVCVAVQSLASAQAVRYLAAALRRGQGRRGYLGAVFLLQMMTLLLFLSLLVQIALWAAVFCWCGEFDDYAASFYHSAVNFTTLGYGDIIMSAEWRLLGPLEAANGILMGGLAAAVLFAVLTRLAGELAVTKEQAK